MGRRGSLASPLRDVPLAAMIVEVLGTVHQLLLGLQGCTEAVNGGSGTGRRAVPPGLYPALTAPRQDAQRSGPRGRRRGRRVAGGAGWRVRARPPPCRVLPVPGHGWGLSCPGRLAGAAADRPSGRPCSPALTALAQHLPLLWGCTGPGPLSGQRGQGTAPRGLTAGLCSLKAPGAQCGPAGPPGASPGLPPQRPRLFAGKRAFGFTATRQGRLILPKRPPCLKP